MKKHKSKIPLINHCIIMKKQILVLVLAVLSGVGLPQKVNGQTHGQTVLDEASWIDNHNFQGGGGYDVSKETGDEYHPWVNTTTEDGWFSYDLSLEKADLSEPLYLACHFNAGDFGRRRTRILIDGELYKDGLFRAVQWKDKFYFWQYALIPAKFWRNADGTLKKDKLTIRFEGTRNESGQFEYSKGVKGVRLVQGGEYSFRCTDWETAFGCRRRIYRMMKAQTACIWPPGERRTMFVFGSRWILTAWYLRHTNIWWCAGRGWRRPLLRTPSYGG